MSIYCYRIWELPSDLYDAIMCSKRHDYSRMSYTNVLYATAEDREHGLANKLGDEFSPVHNRLSDISTIMYGEGASYDSEIDYTILRIFEVSYVATMVGIPFKTIVYSSLNFPNMWFIVDDFSCNDYCNSCDGKTESTVYMTIINNLSEFKNILEEKIIARNTEEMNELVDEDDIAESIEYKVTALKNLQDMSFAEIFSDGRLTKAAR